MRTGTRWIHREERVNGVRLHRVRWGRGRRWCCCTGSPSSGGDGGGDAPWAPRLRVERIPEAGHWVQHEAAERVNALLTRFLRGG